jgi:hypothetical protein
LADTAALAAGAPQARAAQQAMRHNCINELGAIPKGCNPSVSKIVCSSRIAIVVAYIALIDQWHACSLNLLEGRNRAPRTANINEQGAIYQKVGP